MGLDVVIACRCVNGYSPPSPSFGVEGYFSEDVLGRQDGATHALSSLTRYYGPGYERGPWPAIHACLLDLLADPNVEKVWYGSDCQEGLDEVSLEYLTLVNLHYIDNADRPYRKGAMPVKRTLAMAVSEVKGIG